MKFLITVILLFNFTLPAQQRWEKLNGPSGGEIVSFLVKGDSVFASAGAKGKIFYTTNGGQQWLEVNKKFQDAVISMSLTADGGILAAVHNFGLYKTFDLNNWENVYTSYDDFWSVGKDQNGFLYGGTREGKIIISTDNGLSWNVDIQSNSQISNFELTINNDFLAGGWNEILLKNNNNWSVIPFDSVYIIRIFSNNKGIIFGHDNSRLVMSTDGGFEWVQQDSSRFLTTTFIYFMIYNNRIIAGCGPNEFQPGWGILLSDDYGQTWRYTHEGLPPNIAATGPFAKLDNDTYTGSWAAGVFKSTDLGESWFAVNNGLNAAHCLDVSFGIDGNIYSANWSNSFQRSTDNGNSWTVINNGLSNVMCYSIIADDNDVLIGGTAEGIYRSTNKGESWLQTSPAGNNFCFTLYKDTLNRIYALTYGSGVFRTTNLGQSWQRIDSFSNGYAFGFEMDKWGYLYIGTRGGKIFKSVNDGTTWSSVYQSSNPNTVIGGIDSDDEGNIYAANLYEGILRSTDKGITWQKVKTDEAYQLRYPIGVNEEGIYTSGSGDKCFFSSDRGDTWRDITSNLALTRVQEISFDKNGRLYLATDESVWKINPDSITYAADITQTIHEYSLSQNYPNPFNPVTTIKYSIAKSSYVSLRIYDILGNEIAVLVEEQKSAGGYSFEWNASSFVSGVYFYRLIAMSADSQAENFTSTKKLLLIK